MSDNGPTPELHGNECRNCGAELDGVYCAVCGQRRIVGPLKTPEILRDLWSSAVDMDRGFLNTFAGLTVRPGATARAYVDGRRASHTPPFRYFLILLAAWFAFPALIGFDYAAYVARATAEARAVMAQQPAAVTSLVERFVDVSARMYEVRRWTALVNLPLYAVGGLLLFRRSRRTLAEWFAFSLYTIGHSLLLGIVGYVLLEFRLDILFQLVALLVVPYMIWAYHGFSGEPVWTSIVKGLVVFFVGGGVLFCGLFGVLFALSG